MDPGRAVHEPGSNAQARRRPGLGANRAAAMLTLPSEDVPPTPPTPPEDDALPAAELPATASMFRVAALRAHRGGGRGLRRPDLRIPHRRSLAATLAALLGVLVGGLLTWRVPSYSSGPALLVARPADRPGGPAREALLILLSADAAGRVRRGLAVHVRPDGGKGSGTVLRIALAESRPLSGGQLARRFGLSPALARSIRGAVSVALTHSVVPGELPSSPAGVLNADVQIGTRGLSSLIHFN